ncbi:MAG: tetratricopeptide repeat protein [Vicingaceae bacterium]
MIRFYMTFLFLSFLSFSLCSQEEALSRFQAANQSYEEAQYDSSIAAYQALLAEGYSAADLHYNLANAYFKTNQIASAILHYEKALKIDPTHEDAAFNLKLANEKTIDRIESIPELFIYRWWKTIVNLFSYDQWATFIPFLLIIGLLGFALYLFLDVMALRKLGFYTALLCLFLSLLSWFLAHRQSHYLNKTQFAIVMDPTVNINSSPSAGSSKLFVLHEGTKLKVEEEKEKWIKVSLPNGNEGWIKKSLVGVI